MPTAEQLQQRLIPFESLRYTTEAFIDYRIPGCGPKKNYALIGPGVSQNPNQPVSLREQHGFQVGGVSMPHGVTNPPHMHFTAEVFICTKGTWQFHWGFNPERSTAEFGEGDICTVPTWIYRGFRNVGLDDAFMFTALGQDDTGGILWGPSTLAAAQAQGVYLTEDYRIVDTEQGQSLGEGDKLLQPMTPDEIAALRRWTPDQMAQRIVRFATLDWSDEALLDAALPGHGGQLAPAIGLGLTEDRNHAPQVTNAHGFSLEWLKLPAGGSMGRHQLREKQVLVVYRGTLEICTEPDAGAPVRALAAGSPQGWDSYAMPADCWRSYRNPGAEDAVVLLMTPGSGRKTIHWAPDVVAAAAAADRAIDANGYVGAKHFIDRSQR